MNNKKDKDPLLISFSGVCGSGKSTMIKMLMTYLENKGISVRCVDLLHSPVPQNRILLRTSKYLKQKGISDCSKEEYKEVMEAMGLLLTFEANAAPLMDDCQLLIFDRYIDNYVTDEYVSESAKGLLDSMVKCDLRFYLVCDEDIAAERIAKRGRKMQSDLDTAQQKCVDYHNRIIGSDPDYYVVIDSSGSVDEVFRNISRCVDKYLTSGSE